MISPEAATSACLPGTRPPRIHAVTTVAPSLDLHRQVRAGFVRQGTTLKGWCREQGITPSNARDALIGRWDGPKGRALRRKVIKAAQIEVRA